MHANRRQKLCAIIVIGAICLNAPLGLAQTLGVCQPPSPEELAPTDASKNWDADQRTRLLVTSTPTGKKVTFVGDFIRITSATFPSLSRRLGEPRLDISELTFDARKIVVDAPLVFGKVHVTFRANELEIGPKAVLSIREPTAGSLRLLADRITFDRRLRKPFAFFVASAEPLAKPILELSARSVKLAEQTLTGDEALSLVFRYTLDSIYPDSNAADLSSVITLGEQGYQLVKDDLYNHGQWPSYFATKIAAHHAVAPYDSATKQLLGQLIDDNMQLLRDWRSAEPLRVATTVRQLISDNQDGMGWVPEFAPRRNISSQLADLKTKIDDVSESYVKTLISLIVAKEDEVEKRRSEALERLRTERTKVAASVQQSTSELDQAITRADILEQQIADQLNVIQQRRRIHEETIKSLERRGKDIAYIKPVAMIVAVVAMLACQPEIAIPVAAAAQATGEVVYGHNIGEEKSVVNLATAMGRAIQQTNALKDATAQTKKSWAEYQAARQQLQDVRDGEEVIIKEGDKQRPLKKEEAAKTLLDKGAAVAVAVGGILKNLTDKPYAFDVQLTTLEADDATLQQSLGMVSQLRTEQQEYLGKIVELRRLIDAENGQLTRIESAFDELFAGTVKNDVDIARWASVSMTLWTEHFAAAYRTAVTLRRSYQVLTGRPLVTTTRLDQMPSAMLAYEQLGGFDPFVEGARAESTLTAHLNGEWQRFTTAIRALLSAIEDGKNAYMSSRFSGSVANYRFQFSQGHPAGSVERRFLDRVNKLLEEAWERARANRGGGNARILIPMTFDGDAVDSPEYFLAAEVARAVVGGGSDLGASIRFRIEHQGYGEFWRNRKCTLVDFRLPGALNRYENVTTMPPFNPTQTVYTPEAVRRDVEGENFYTYLPARAQYLLSISVTGQPTQKKVAVSQLDVKLHYFK